jgi:AcrR family transcriptional regulator
MQFLQDESDPRRARILMGAMQVFLAYGFQRTTMNDIARAAEISRPALYLQFKNKTDIYRALASTFLRQVMARTRLVLENRQVPLSERLHQATLVFINLIQEIEEAPHGVELLDMQSSLAGDIFEAGRAEMAELLSRTIEESVGAKRQGLDCRGLSCAGLANMLLDAIDGLKMRRPGADEKRRLQNEYVCAVAALLEL